MQAELDPGHLLDAWIRIYVDIDHGAEVFDPINRLLLDTEHEALIGALSGW
jgi:hypothetical protein